MLCNPPSLCNPPKTKSAFVDAFVDAFDTPMPNCVKSLFASVYVLRTLLYEWSKYTVDGDGSVSEADAVQCAVSRLKSHETAPYIRGFLEDSEWINVFERSKSFESACNIFQKFIDESLKPAVRKALDASVFETIIGMASSFYATQMLNEWDDGILECYSKKLDEHSPKAFLKYNVANAVEQIQAQLLQRNYRIHLLRKKIRMESIFVEEEKPLSLREMMEEELSRYEQKLDAHKEELRQELEKRQELLDELNDWGNELMAYDWAH